MIPTGKKILGLLLFGALVSLRAAAPVDLPETCYLFSYFYHDRQADGLRLAWSRDGLAWEMLNRGAPCLQPQVGEAKLMRDPCLYRGPDGTFHLVWTTAWSGKTIGHASSRDLLHWRLLTRPLTRASQLNLLGDPDSCGVWAPCLTHADGKFWLIYTDVKRYGRTTVGGASGASLRDFHNYLVTADRIDGEWSDPVYLNSSGFDPSLFHDDDGRKYLVNMLWDHRPGQNRFAGIVLQEYSVADRKLVGPRENIFRGTAIGFTEAPHLYRRDGWYYLLTAEGGTGWGHAVTLARSRHLRGPYELHPDTYALTARHRPDAALQRTGHADLVETQNGETYMVYLCGRPLPNRGRCTLGRETAIQRMV